MIELNPDITTTVATITGGVGAIVFGVSKAVKVWAQDRGEIQKYSAEADLFQRMNTELTRLAAVNQAQEQEISELREKLSKLVDDFAAFKQTVIAKDMEISTLKAKLQKYEAI